MRNEHGLTPQQERFAVLLAEGKSQAEAYRQAYPASKRWKADSVYRTASVLAADLKVSTRVAALQAVAADRAILKATEIMEETRRVALSRPQGIIGIRDGKPYVLMPNELDEATAAAVKSFEIDDLGRIKYSFWDKNAALERAAKILGLFERDNEQKTDPLSRLLAGLKGNVMQPAPGAATPEDDDDEGGGEDD